MMIAFCHEEKAMMRNYSNKLYQPISLGEKLFKFRDVTPVPLLLLMFLVARPSVLTATVGLLVIFLGEVMRFYSVAYIGPVSRTRKGSLGGLITTGPFAWTRNPLYVGNFCIVVGFSFFAGVSWFFFLALGGFCFQYYFIIQYEESLLLAKFGDDYIRYKEKTPLFFPRRFPKKIEMTGDFNLAFKSEKRTLLSIFSVLILLLLFS